MLAKYSAKCKHCKKPIREGLDYIAKADIPGCKRPGWIHTDCAIELTRRQREPEPEPQPQPQPQPEPESPVKTFEDQARELAREEAFRAIEEADLRGTSVEITVADRPAVEVDLAHEKLTEAVELAVQGMNVLLVGPSGCGKTFLAEQVAETLGLSFATISCTGGMSEGHLTGRLLPTGEGGRFEYHRSPFVRSFEEGGVFLLDEIDAADENTLLVLNQALANGALPIPQRTAAPSAGRHSDFVCIAAANTYGTGADRVYVGRNQLDDSTLDRFRIGTLELDYSETVEQSLCPDDELRERILGIRRKAREAKLRRVVSTRFLEQAYVMLRAGWTIPRILEALTSGWSDAEKGAVQ